MDTKISGELGFLGFDIYETTVVGVYYAVPHNRMAYYMKDCFTPNFRDLNLLKQHLCDLKTAELKQEIRSVEIIKQKLAAKAAQ